MEGFVALPEDVKLAITALVVAGVVFAVRFVIGVVPWLSFLEAYAQEWGLIIAALVIDWIQNVLPTGSDDLAVKFILFILALIGMVVKFARSRQVRGFSLH